MVLPADQLENPAPFSLTDFDRVLSFRMNHYVVFRGKTTRARYAIATLLREVAHDYGDDRRALGRIRQLISSLEGGTLPTKRQMESCRKFIQRAEDLAKQEGVAA